MLKAGGWRTESMDIRHAPAFNLPPLAPSLLSSPVVFAGSPVSNLFAAPSAQAF